MTIVCWLARGGWVLLWLMTMTALWQPRLEAAQDETLPGGPGHPEVARPGGDLPGDPRIELVKLVDGLGNPLAIAFAPGDDRLFVVEGGGLVRIAHRDGAIEPEPFLDLTARVPEGGDEGLVGLAFHPDFAQNGQVFVSYAPAALGEPLVVSRFTVAEDEPLRVDPDSETPLLRIDRPTLNHAAGSLRFGPDGYLYVSVGDGGGDGDPFDVAQSRYSLLGKILRIDVDAATADRPYGVPDDNPFVGPGRHDNPYTGQPVAPERGERRRARAAVRDQILRAPVLPEIWAFGLRNPWSVQFDPATGDIYIVDPGASSWEEIDYLPAGASGGVNFGWDWLEASHCYPAEREECPRQQVGELPVAEYQIGEAGCAAIGLGVYRGSAAPALDGIYFTGDYCSGVVRGLQRDEQGVWQYQDLADTPLLITGSGQDAQGELYVTAFASPDGEAAGVQGGSVWMIASPGQTAPAATPDEMPAADRATPLTGPEAAAPTTELALVIRDDAIEPERLTVPAGSPAMLSVTNETASARVCAIPDLDVDLAVAPGETASATVTLDARRARLVCADATGESRPLSAFLATRE